MFVSPRFHKMGTDVTLVILGLPVLEEGQTVVAVNIVHEPTTAVIYFGPLFIPV